MAKPVRISFNNKIITIGGIVHNKYHRTISSEVLYWAFGGSFGIDLDAIDQLKSRGVEMLEITIKDWGKTYQISLLTFLNLAKLTTFVGTKRLHVPFKPYWTLLEETNSEQHQQNPNHQLKLSLVTDKTLEPSA